MFDRIVYISDQYATVKLLDNVKIAMNLMNLHIIFQDSTKTILGEVDDFDDKSIKVRFLGEIADNKLISGVIRKPSLDAKIRVINQSEIPLICGADNSGYMNLGVSPFYNDYPVFLDVDKFFSSHFAVFGNSGSGKSCGVTRLFQNMFRDQRLFPYKANIVLFDSSGEYYNAFSNLNDINSNYHYRFYSTNEENPDAEKLRIPIFLLNQADLALLLQATNHSQLPIIERMLKLALIFSQDDMDANKYKNHLIAKAIMTVLYTNETSPNKRNEIFSIINSCSTPEFGLETVIKGVGYTRKFRECFLIDNQGQFSESVLLTQYVTSFINNDYDNYEPKTGVFYTLDTLEKALNFALISEGWLRNKNTYGDAITLKVRLHSLIVSQNAKFFEYPAYTTLESYLSSILMNAGAKYQMVNINFDDVDDDFAKTITKIYSRLIFEFSKGLANKASIPFHIVVEEAHRYIQNDTDRFLIGYNIFERIAKEGRKFGVLLGLISQRPVELSDTVISQCSNFLIFKMNHPVDVEYIRKMVPNISDEIVEKQKTLQPGTCLGFGQAFRIPLIVKMEMPDPAPSSGNCEIVKIWSGGGKTSAEKGFKVEEEKIEIPESVSTTETEVVTESPEQVQIPQATSSPVQVPTASPVPPQAAQPVQQVPAAPPEPGHPGVPVQPNTAINAVSNGSTPVNPFLVEKDKATDVIISLPEAPSEANFVRQQYATAAAQAVGIPGSMTDDALNAAVNQMPMPTIGGYSLTDKVVQSALPDFTTSSEDEREGRIDSYIRPAARSGYVETSGITSEVKSPEPPAETSQPALTTDTGIPLVNLVD